MADTKPAKAKDGEEKAPPPPAVGVILELYFPMTKAILPTNFMTEAEAVHAAFDHFTAFPSGYAQVRDAPTSRVLLNHQQLFQRFRGK
jgi:hypothetical protein